jgi:hypothetical protein
MCPQTNYDSLDAPNTRVCVCVLGGGGGQEDDGIFDVTSPPVRGVLCTQYVLRINNWVYTLY